MVGTLQLALDKKRRTARPKARRYSADNIFIRCTKLSRLLLMVAGLEAQGQAVWRKEVSTWTIDMERAQEYRMLIFM